MWRYDALTSNAKLDLYFVVVVMLTQLDATDMPDDHDAGVYLCVVQQSARVNSHPSGHK